MLCLSNNIRRSVLHDSRDDPNWHSGERKTTPLWSKVSYRELSTCRPQSARCAPIPEGQKRWNESNGNTVSYELFGAESRAPMAKQISKVHRLLNHHLAEKVNTLKSGSNKYEVEKVMYRRSFEQSYSVKCIFQGIARVGAVQYSLTWSIHLLRFSITKTQIHKQLASVSAILLPCDDLRFEQNVCDVARGLAWHIYFIWKCTLFHIS